MSLFSSPIKSLDDLFVHTLQDIYYAEQQITQNLPTMAEKASNPALKAAFQHHLAETEHQLKRLEQVFQLHGQKPRGVQCKAIEGILAEAKEIISDSDNPAAQAVEHYEISRYGSLIAFAQQLGKHDCAKLLGETLAEEKAADQKLSTIAQTRVNLKAA
jgi:ferritin-like metal-binding protein YciE